MTAEIVGRGAGEDQNGPIGREDEERIASNDEDKHENENENGDVSTGELEGVGTGSVEDEDDRDNGRGLSAVEQQLSDGARDGHGTLALQRPNIAGLSIDTGATTAGADQEVEVDEDGPVLPGGSARGQAVQPK